MKFSDDLQDGKADDPVMFGGENFVLNVYDIFEHLLTQPNTKCPKQPHNFSTIVHGQN